MPRGTNPKRRRREVRSELIYIYVTPTEKRRLVEAAGRFGGLSNLIRQALLKEFGSDSVAARPGGNP